MTRTLPAALAAALALSAPARAGLEITASADDFVPKADKDPAVRAQALGADGGGNTSLRLQSDKPVDDNKFPDAPGSPNNNKIAPPKERKVRQRDRDLGQTFLTGDKGYAVDAVYLRLGFGDKAVLPGVPGSRAALQFFEVTGEPKLNDSGTPGRLGKFDRAKSPELDDYLEGETYTSVRVTAAGKMPAKLDKGYYLKFDLTGEDEVALKPNTHYAFVLMFLDRGEGRSMTLANSYFGDYTPDPKRKLVGHGIRREGGVGKAEAPEFEPDLPDDLKARTALPPGTLGFPDVCTFRDLYFTVTGK